jgi:SAM-dependent methyltransferase
VTNRRDWQGHEGDVLDSVGGFDVIACGSCDFKHIVPIPTPEELGVVYRHQYYSEEKPLYLERSREDAAWWDTVFADRYDTFEQLLPTGRRRLLDVGSGPGSFLMHGNRRGWRTLGVEPSRQAAAYTRSLGLEVVEEFLTPDIAMRLGTFDAIHANEVFEHLPDPRGTVEILSDMLAPGGVLCVCVPNDYSPVQATLREACGYSPWWVAPPHHVNFFDGDSLEMLLTAAGMRVVLREATFPIDLFLLMGENYVGDDELGRRCHGLRKTMELNLVAGGRNDLKRRLYRSLAELGIGREVVMYGVKPDAERRDEARR